MKDGRTKNNEFLKKEESEESKKNTTGKEAKNMEKEIRRTRKIRKQQKIWGVMCSNHHMQLDSALTLSPILISVMDAWWDPFVWRAFAQV